MALPLWKVLLFNRSSGAALGEFTQYANASYTKKLNAAGSGAITVSLDDPIASLIDPLDTVLAFERNGTIKWSGPIITREDSVPTRSVAVQAVGFFDVLIKRVFRQDRTVFTNIDAGQIASAIVAEANAQSDTGIRVTSVETTSNRTRTFKRYSSMGQAITELSQVENGFDFEVVGQSMRIYAQQGVDRSITAAAGVDRVVLGFQAATQNIASFTKRIETANFTNRINVVTVGSTEIVEDSESVALYGLYETTEDLRDVSSDIGRAYAAAEIAVRGMPMETIDVTLISVDEDERSPRFDGSSQFDTHYFGLGDKVRVIVQDPGLPLIDATFRVFGATLQLDQNGAERVTGLQLAAPLRTNITTARPEFEFRDTGGVFTSTNAGNPADAVTYDGDGYIVSSQPYVNIPASQTWIVGDPIYSLLGVTTILT